MYLIVYNFKSYAGEGGHPPKRLIVGHANLTLLSHSCVFSQVFTSPTRYQRSKSSQKGVFPINLTFRAPRLKCMLWLDPVVILWVIFTATSTRHIIEESYPTYFPAYASAYPPSVICLFARLLPARAAFSSGRVSEAVG